MSDTPAQPWAAFRLNLEQQKKRAKELLQAARSGKAETLQRLQQHCRGLCADSLQLAQAQHCIARELRFANWAALQAQLTLLQNLRSDLARHTTLDADCRTMHIRCGDDLRQALLDAGFKGTFNRHINPYLQGPVTAEPDWLEQRARFITDNAGPYLALNYAAVLQVCREEESNLERASQNFDRVVLWFEHDCYDQFVLLRCLAWFAEHGAPPLLQLVSANDFPGHSRFIGLGQLPPEALQLLWQRRQTLGQEHCSYALQVWDAFRAADPRRLMAFMRNNSPLLPDLAGALHRHLQELPAPSNGLGLTQQLLLQTLAEFEALDVGRLVGLIIHERDPLPGLGDIAHDQLLREFAALPEPLVTRTGKLDWQHWEQDSIRITAAGRALLAAELNWLHLPVATRWVGGVQIVPARKNWHWDEARQDLLLR